MIFLAGESSLLAFPHLSHTGWMCPFVFNTVLDSAPILSKEEKHTKSVCHCCDSGRSSGVPTSLHSQPSLQEVPSASQELGLSCVSLPRARSGFTAESLRCATLTPALDPRPTVLPALIRSCWKDTGRATCDLFSPPSLSSWAIPCAFFPHKAFSCQRPRQRHVINTQLPDDSHRDSECTQGAVAPACRRASSCTSGLGQQSTHPLPPHLDGYQG